MRKLNRHVGKRQTVGKEDIYSLEVRIQRVSSQHVSALQPLEVG